MSKYAFPTNHYHLMPALQKTRKMFTKPLYWQKLDRWLGLYSLLLARYVPNVAKEEYYEISVRIMNIDNRRPTDRLATDPGVI